jgi:hypothetical protein
MDEHMKKTQFTEEQIINVVRLAEAGQNVGDMCRVYCPPAK